jgi:hypothetical protein
VLKGSEGNLTQFKFIRTEAADFESYGNCTQVEELTDYLARFGFKRARSDKFAESRGGGRYFDLLSCGAPWTWILDYKNDNLN